MNDSALAKGTSFNVRDALPIQIGDIYRNENLDTDFVVDDIIQMDFHSRGTYFEIYGKALCIRNSEGHFLGTTLRNKAGSAAEYELDPQFSQFYKFIRKATPAELAWLGM